MSKHAMPEVQFPVHVLIEDHGETEIHVLKDRYSASAWVTKEAQTYISREMIKEFPTFFWHLASVQGVGTFHESATYTVRSI